jgi:ADP-ribose pyrophosphatase
MRQHGPWKVKKHVLKYKNPWIAVHEDQVIRPDGKPGIYGTVRFLPGISVVVLDDKDCVYLVELFQYALGRKSIETVSGGMDKGETPLQTAKRELKEELGMEAKEWADLGVIHMYTSIISGAPQHLFLARKLKKTRMKREGTEVLKPIKVKLSQAVGWVLESKIVDAQSSMAILKANEYLKNH